MVHRYLRDNGHGFTIIQVVLYDQIFIFIVNHGSNGCYDRRNHACIVVTIDRLH
jgi:hypothetical protein